MTHAQMQGRRLSAGGRASALIAAVRTAAHERHPSLRFRPIHSSTGRRAKRERRLEHKWRIPSQDSVTRRFDQVI